MSREEEEGEEEDGEEREREKARVDDLWASFKEDAALQKRKENDAREGSTGAVCSKARCTRYKLIVVILVIML